MTSIEVSAIALTEAALGLIHDVGGVGLGHHLGARRQGRNGLRRQLAGPGVHHGERDAGLCQQRCCALTRPSQSGHDHMGQAGQEVSAGGGKRLLHGDGVRSHYLSFRVARDMRAKITAAIQKRMITLDSGQPASSK